MPENIVIIGAGPAGCAAAVQCQRLGVTPLLFDSQGKAGGLVAAAYCIENYPGLETPVPGSVFALRLQQHLKRFEVSVQKQTVTAVMVSPKGHGWLVHTTDGIIETRSVIAATGTVPNLLGLSGETEFQEHVFYELTHLNAVHPHPSSAVIVGGGEAAMDYALSLAQNGTAVQVLVRGPKPAAKGRVLALALAHPLIAVLNDTTVLSLSRKPFSAELQSAGKTGVVFPEVLLVACGRQSRIETLVDFSVLGPKQSCLHQSLTPAPGLFICGDARFARLGQIGQAVGDGLACAALAVSAIAF